MIAWGPHTYEMNASKSSRPRAFTINPRTYNRRHTSVVEMTMKAMLKLTRVLPCESGGRLNIEKSIGAVELLIVNPRGNAIPES